MNIKKISKWLLLAAGSYSLAPSYIGKAIRRKERKHIPNTLFLTFDDGPSAEYTPALLDLLWKYDVRASFFVVADFASENPELIYRMQREGHLVGFHSKSHSNAYFMSAAKTEADFSDGLKTMSQLDIAVKYFRPPWGNVNLASLGQIKKYGLNLVLWDVMAQDWQGDITAAEIARRLRERAFEGAVICLHDGRGSNDAPARTIEALEIMIPEWLEQGYSFRLVDQYEKF